MFELTAVCGGCAGGRTFPLLRRNVTRTMAGGQVYQIDKVACPFCGALARVTGIREG